MTPRYKLRTLLIVLALGPPVLAGAWWAGGLMIASYSKRNQPRCGGVQFVDVPYEFVIIEP
jgi:hypothetical protein